MYIYIYIVRFCTLNLLRSSKHLIDTITAQAVHQSLRLQKLFPLHRGCPWHATPHQVGNFTLTVFNQFKVVLQHVVWYRCYSAFFDSRLRQHRSSRGFFMVSVNFPEIHHCHGSRPSRRHWRARCAARSTRPYIEVMSCNIVYHFYHVTYHVTYHVNATGPSTRLRGPNSAMQATHVSQMSNRNSAVQHYSVAVHQHESYQ